MCRGTIRLGNTGDQACFLDAPNKAYEHNISQTWLFLLPFAHVALRITNTMTDALSGNEMKKAQRETNTLKICLTGARYNMKSRTLLFG